MGRTVRRVHQNWEHPQDENSNFIPLLEGPYSKRLESWEEGRQKWSQGLQDDWNGGWKKKDPEYDGMQYFEYAGQRPFKDEYMPEWSNEESTHYQMYEDTTEGTPLSPVMSSPEELAQWLADNKASFFGGESTTYEHWLDICGGGCGLPIFVAPAPAGDITKK